jgi:hypothetical protein
MRLGVASEGRAGYAVGEVPSLEGVDVEAAHAVLAGVEPARWGASSRAPVPTYASASEL